MKMSVRKNILADKGKKIKNYAVKMFWPVFNNVLHVSLCVVFVNNIFIFIY